MFTHSSRDGDGFDRDNTSWVSPSSSSESLPICTYTTVRISELSRLHTTIATLQADERRREAVIAEMAATIKRQEDEIARLEMRESVFWGLLVLGLGLGGGFWINMKSKVNCE